MWQQGRKKIPQKKKTCLPPPPNKSVLFRFLQNWFLEQKNKTIPIARGGVQIFSIEPSPPSPDEITRWRVIYWFVFFHSSLTSIVVIIDCVIWNERMTAAWVCQQKNASKNIFTWIYRFFVCHLKSWSTSRR